MKPTFYRLNDGWNAEPYIPSPIIEIQGRDLVLKFLVNAFQFTEFAEGELGILRFTGCQRYRLGPVNDDGWYAGQCRFSRWAPEWGEFYVVQGDAALLEAPQDWHTIAAPSEIGRHFLFYFRDHTFECAADACLIEPSANNSLHRIGKSLHVPSAEELKPAVHLRKRLCRSQ